MAAGPVRTAKSRMASAGSCASKTNRSNRPGTIALTGWTPLPAFWRWLSRVCGTSAPLGGFQGMNRPRSSRRMSTSTQGVATKSPHPPVPSSIAAGLRDPYMSACHRGSIESSRPRRSNWTTWLRQGLPGAGRGPPSPIPRTGCPSRPNDRLPSGSNTSVCTGWPAALVTTTVSGFGRTSTRSAPTLAVAGAVISRRLTAGAGYDRSVSAGVRGKSPANPMGLSVTRMLCSPAARMSSCAGWPAAVIGCAGRDTTVARCNQRTRTGGTKRTG